MNTITSPGMKRILAALLGKQLPQERNAV